MKPEGTQAEPISATEENRPDAEPGNRSATPAGRTGMFSAMKHSLDSLAKYEGPIELMGHSFSIPNLLSILRLVSMPVLLFAAWTARPLFFQITLVVVLLMALADGVLARRLGQVTDFGAELDSWGVLAAYITIPLCAWLLWPEIVRREAAFVITLVIFHVVPALLGLLKYGRLTSYHTWGSKLSAVLLSLTIFTIILGGPAWPFRLISPIVILSGIEEIFMTGILRQWQTNIPSLWHAHRIEQGRVEQALQESEKRYREILLNIEDGYLELDLAGHLIFFNPTLCKYSGYSAEELVGMDNRSLMDERQSKIMFETFNEVYRTGRSSIIQEGEFIRKDGQRRYFEGSINLARNARGQPIGFRCFGRDITERKLAEERDRIHQEQLYQAGKMVALGTLVSGVAHEINNPNNFIMLNTPLLEEAWKGIRPILDDYYEENGDFLIGGQSYSEMRTRIPTLFSGIVDGARRIEQIIEDLKNYVRKGTADLTEPVDINQIVKSALSLVSHMVRRSTNRLTTRYGNHLPLINGNAQRLEQVIINLVQNACQALPDPKAGITVSTELNRASRQIVLTVEDQGSGIPEENLPHITDTFYTTRSDTGGVGLGLSISAKIVEEHGGRMQFASAPGRGTTVTVTLPVAGAKPGETT